jgi:DNA-binding CsgD family transcriptional regulator
VPSGNVEVRLAVVARGAAARERLLDAVAAVADAVVVAWADSHADLLVLGTRADFCICDVPPDRSQEARLRARGCTAVPVPEGADPVAALAAARAGGARNRLVRPALAPRQLEVMMAYVATGDLLPTVARGLGMDSETFKTHLRRIRTKYAQAGRPAPTRRDLYVRAVEDGLIPPPPGSSWH